MCNFKTEFSREWPKLKDKINEIKKIQCKVATAANVAWCGKFNPFFCQFLKPFPTSNTCFFVNIAWKMNCNISKSKLILCKWNVFHFIEIAFIGFMLHETKQCIVFFLVPGRSCQVTLTHHWYHCIHPYKTKICFSFTKA